jgi:GT2 family glycosyltransferase
LNRRLSEVGRLLYVPDALITHNHGRRMKKFAERIFEFGKGRGSLFLWDWQFIPPIIVGLLILSLALSPWPLIAAICIYVFVVVAMGLKITIQEKRLEYLVSVPVVYLVEHSSYSFGIWTGLLESVLKRLFARGSAV